MNTTIYVHIKSNYGRDCYYINDPDVAKAVRVLTKKVTLDRHDIDALKQLGFTVQIKAEAVTL
jgi:G:T-mismatch repair DNA endonuclease (very short patch repair protein)